MHECKLSVHSSKGKVKKYSSSKSVLALHKGAAIFILVSRINANRIHYNTILLDESIHLFLKRFV